MLEKVFAQQPKAISSKYKFIQIQLLNVINANLNDFNCFAYSYSYSYSGTGTGTGSRLKKY